MNLKPTQWQCHLAKAGRLRAGFYNEDKTALDAHPLVREYQAKVLQTRFRPAWRQGNKQLYKLLPTAPSIGQMI